MKVSESISVLVSSPKEIILDEASSWAADLIVLGSHGHRGIDRFLLGSVSEEVAMHAKCSVESVRQLSPCAVWLPACTSEDRRSIYHADR